MAVHSCVNGKMNGEAIKQHAEGAADIVCLTQTCYVPCYGNRMVCLCCATIALHEPVYGLVSVLLDH